MAYAIKHNIKIQHSCKSSMVWKSLNPVLLYGELGLEADTGKIKFGDGVNKWNDLPYCIVDIDDIPTEGSDKFITSDGIYRAITNEYPLLLDDPELSSKIGSDTFECIVPPSVRCYKFFDSSVYFDKVTNRYVYYDVFLANNKLYTYYAETNNSAHKSLHLVKTFTDEQVISLRTMYNESSSMIIIATKSGKLFYSNDLGETFSTVDLNMSIDSFNCVPNQYVCVSDGIIYASCCLKKEFKQVNVFYDMDDSLSMMQIDTRFSNVSLGKFISVACQHGVAFYDDEKWRLVYINNIAETTTIKKAIVGYKNCIVSISDSNIYCGYYDSFNKKYSFGGYNFISDKLDDLILSRQFILYSENKLYASFEGSKWYELGSAEGNSISSSFYYNPEEKKFIYSINVITDNYVKKMLINTLDTYIDSVASITYVNKLTNALNAKLDELIPAQTGHINEILSTDGIHTAWVSTHMISDSIVSNDIEEAVKSNTKLIPRSEL